MATLMITAAISGYSVWVLWKKYKDIRKGKVCCGCSKDCSGCHKGDRM